MQFGVFDQNDRGVYSLSEQYEKRLQLIEFYDRAGFRTYHMSEHHSTPLSMTPSPSVFLAAAAQRTRRIRLNPLVYVLPAHNPLRLAEEICMVDHLSQGRFDIGVGRGASPHELQDFGVDPETSPAAYVEAYDVIMQALTQAEVNFSGEHFKFDKVPVEIKPMQQPHPPVWYAVPVPDGAVWPALHAINVVAGGPVAKVREITDRYRAEWAKLGRAPENLPFLGINRFVVCADTDREALALGKRAWPKFHENFMKLWRKYGTQPRYARVPDDFEVAVQNGAALVGSAATIHDQVYKQASDAGVSYFISQFSFGDLSHEEVMHSASLFAEEVIPVARELALSA